MRQWVTVERAGKSPGFIGCIYLVYARHGRELMGCKSPVRRIQSLPFGGDTKVLADGKGVSARRGLKEARAQSYEPTNRNSIQGRVTGQVSTT